MPSFKVVLSSIALAAFALSPVAASPLAVDEGLEHLTRRMDLETEMLVERDIAAPGAIARRESREEEAERVRLAKSRAARKAKRSVQKRATSYVGTATPAFLAFINTACTADSQCASFASNGARVCLDGLCSIQCSGTSIINRQGRCVQSSRSCPTPPTNAAGTATGTYRFRNNACTLVCNNGFINSGSNCVDPASVPSTTPCAPGSAVGTCPTQYVGTATPAFTSYINTPCTTASQCAGFSTNGGRICLAGFCSIQCLGTSIINRQGRCVQSSRNCPAPPTSGGVPTGTYRFRNNTCTLVCNNGLVAAGTSCVNPNTSPDSCGANGVVCPGSYNGIGTRVCVAGTCSLSCPDGQPPFAAGGGLACNA